jgi:hypothetical protein
VSTTNPADPKMNLEVVNYTINACKLLQASKNNFLIKIFLENFHSNFKMECPFKKGNYDIVDWEFSDTFVPKFLKKIKFISSCYLIAKFPDWDRYKVIFSYNAYGELK